MKNLLLDRDGVLNANRHYDYTPETMVLLPGVIEGLKRFTDAGWEFFVVSNQSGVGRGLVTEESVRACNERLREMLAKEGIILTDIVYCPHHPDDHCSCRKPALGMWHQLAKKHGLTPVSCVMVGNSRSDIAFGRAIGCRTALVAPLGAPLVSSTPGGIVPDLPTLEHLVRLTMDPPASFEADVVVSDLRALADHFLERHHPGPVVPLREAVLHAERSRLEGKIIVTTNGAFDLFHAGHRFLLSEARKHGDLLIVGVNSDTSVKRNKGPDRPRESEQTRAQNVAEYADLVFIFDDDDPRPWLPLIHPHAHVNAETYGKECVEADVLRKIGARLVLVPVRPELGSTTGNLKRSSPSAS